MNRNLASNVKQMTQLALLTVIIVLMAFTPLGYLRTGTVEITFIVVPVAIGAILLGAKAGAFLGLVFGLTSLVQCFGMSPMGALMLSLNPLGTIFCCIVPRVLVGVVPALLYPALRKLDHRDSWSIAVSCLVTPLTNTILYLVCMCTIFQSTLMEAYQYTGKGGIYFLGFIFATVAVNAVLEAISALVIGTAVCKALKKAFHI